MTLACSRRSDSGKSAKNRTTARRTANKKNKQTNKQTNKKNAEKLVDGQREAQSLRVFSLAFPNSRLPLDRGQTREICEKQEKYLKGKVVTFTVQSLILCQYPVDLLTFLELY